MTRRIGMLLCAGVLLGACGGSSTQARRTNEARARVARNERASTIAATPAPGSDPARCDANVADREQSEYDTSGDDVPDVRKVFLVIGAGTPTQRHVLICRESDLNADGAKDVVRYYNDEGRAVREEADRNFDGRMDSSTYFEGGRIVRVEVDANYDGAIDTKIFYERGVAVRSEVDAASRSTATEWRPNQWQYFEQGRMIRMGTDVDGDGRVDRWDRDETIRREATTLGGGENAPTDDSADDGEETAEAPADAGPPDAGPPASGRRRR